MCRLTRNRFSSLSRRLFRGFLRVSSSRALHSRHPMYFPLWRSRSLPLRHPRLDRGSSLPCRSCTAAKEGPQPSMSASRWLSGAVPPRSCASPPLLLRTQTHGLVRRATIGLMLRIGRAGYPSRRRMALLTRSPMPPQ